MQPETFDLEAALWGVGGVVAAVLAGWLIHRLLFAMLGRFAIAPDGAFGAGALAHLRRPLGLVIPLLVVLVVLPAVPLAPAAEVVVLRAISLGVIAGIGWLVVAAINAAGDYAALRFRIDKPDNLSERQITTRVNMFRRIALVVVVVVTAAAMLMTVPSIRHLGVSLFASAGIAGIVIGLAAQRALANLIAGIQIALTDPMRIDDVVIIEGEWGWIEEIRTTYVVVRIWDLRRLVVPLSHFIEHPFQNWTRQTADILGTVFLYVDYTVPVDELRGELHRILQATDLWDGKVWNVQVTDATERTLEVRALVSAENSGRAWELRCLVRERLVAFLRERYPEALPRARAELVRGAPPELEPKLMPV